MLTSVMDEIHKTFVCFSVFEAPWFAERLTKNSPIPSSNKKVKYFSIEK